jgi:hypothetical protein
MLFVRREHMCHIYGYHQVIGLQFLKRDTWHTRRSQEMGNFVETEDWDTRLEVLAYCYSISLEIKKWVWKVDWNYLGQ